MRPATAPPGQRADVRMLVVATGSPGPALADPALADPGASLRNLTIADLVDLLDPGDVLVVNDAATLPASIHGHTPTGDELELRLLGPGDPGAWRAVVFGAGDWHVPTENRPAPPALAVGDAITLRGGLTATLLSRSPLSERLVTVAFDASGAELWSALYAAGRPVQYAYVDDELELWSVQTVYGGRPWAAEMPSAGRPLTWSLLLALRRKGVVVAALTHAAGLSSTGDPELDRALPLPERYDIPGSTAAAIAAARRLGNRVIAVGTTVVRALEGCAAQNHGVLRAGTGVTDLVIHAGFRPAVVDGLLTGVHDPSESHYHLLRAFADEHTLQASWRTAAALGYRCHEFGDTSLLLPRR